MKRAYKKQISTRGPGSGETKICETCNVGIRGNHLRSSSHLRRAELVKLASDPTITLSEIGEALGVSFQRARQIISRIPGAEASGRVRSNNRTAARKRKRDVDNLRARIGSVLCREIDQRGLDILPVRWNRFRLNDNLYLIVQTNTSNTNGRGTTPYYHIRNPPEEYDYLIAICDSRTYIMPRAWLGEGDIYLPVEEIKHKNSKDWEQWRDRFDLLT
jgi:hypothetical protein